MDKTLKKKKEETFEEYCHRISQMRQDLNMTWTHIANLINDETGFDYSADKYRKQEKRFVDTSDTDETDDILDDEEDNDEEFIPYGKESVSVNYEKNETTSTKDISLTDDELHNPSAILKAHGFDPELWDIKTVNNTKTNRKTITGDSFVYSSKVTVKPKETEDVTLQTVETFFAGLDESKLKNLHIEPKQYDPNGEFLEICIQDLHMGLLSYAQETGEDYDVDIATQRLNNCIADILQRTQGRKFKRIVFALLGDILHVDNLEGSTTKGTRQDTDTRPTRLFDKALEALLYTIEQLGEIAPVEVVCVSGNHDGLTGQLLCKCLEMAFRNDDNVTFFNSPNPRKWRRYGKVLIGFAHGDMKPNAVSEWLSNECDEWSLAKYREVHMGHLHSIQTLQKIEDNKYGLIARYLPALCASSAWEHDMGYPKSQRGMMSFVWNENTGLREIWYSNI